MQTSLERFGVEVPTLNPSIYSVSYVKTRDDGTEVYTCEGREVQVGPGQVIDSHGNVVNLRALSAQMCIIQPRRSDRSDDLCGVLEFIERQRRGELK